MTTNFTGANIGTTRQRFSSYGQPLLHWRISVSRVTLVVGYAVIGCGASNSLILEYRFLVVFNAHTSLILMYWSHYAQIIEPSDLSSVNGHLRSSGLLGCIVWFWFGYVTALIPPVKLSYARVRINRFCTVYFSGHSSHLHMDHFLSC